MRARSVAVMNDEKPDAQIHQGIGNGVPGAARANQHDRRALRGVAPERFLEAVAPAAAVEIIAGCAAVRCNRHGIDRAGLRRLGVDGVEQRHDLLLERESDVGAGKAGGLDRGEQLRQSAFARPIKVDQMIEAVDAGGGEGVGKQRSATATP